MERNEVFQRLVREEELRIDGEDIVYKMIDKVIKYHRLGEGEDIYWLKSIGCRVLDYPENVHQYIPKRYPLNIIQAYEQYKKGKTISNEYYPFIRYNKNDTTLEAMGFEEIDANWRVDE